MQVNEFKDHLYFLLWIYGTFSWKCGILNSDICENHLFSNLWSWEKGFLLNIYWFPCSARFFLREICGSLPEWIQYFNFFVLAFLYFIHIMTVFLMQRIHYFLNLINIKCFSCFYLKHSIINSIFIYIVYGFSTPFWCSSPHATPQIILHTMTPFHNFINSFS